MTGQHLLVSLVDDDQSVRESLPDLLKELGCEARVFSSAEEFLGSGCIEQTKCLVLDVAMPGMSGPDLFRELKRQQKRIPVIFVTGQRDDKVRQRMVDLGGVECLFKPFTETALADALKAAFRKR